tara:strand:- start:71 stop:292 length:222 start_codon:yes stop_codon:yes gene_type:complete
MTTTEHIRAIVAEAPYAVGDYVSHGPYSNARVLAVSRKRGKFSYDLEVCTPQGSPMFIVRRYKDAWLGEGGAE